MLLFTFREAACLLAGEEIETWPPSIRVKEKIHVLLKGACENQLKLIPPADSQGQDFDIGYIIAGEEPPVEKLDMMKVQRRELRRFLRTEGHPIPRFLHEKLDPEEQNEC